MDRHRSLFKDIVLASSFLYMCVLDLCVLVLCVPDVESPTNRPLSLQKVKSQSASSATSRSRSAQLRHSSSPSPHMPCFLPDISLAVPRPQVPVTTSVLPLCADLFMLHYDLYISTWPTCSQICRNLRRVDPSVLPFQVRIVFAYTDGQPMLTQKDDVFFTLNSYKNRCCIDRLGIP